jgi:protein involved in polysaccharide export with SLBB domain
VVSLLLAGGCADPAGWWKTDRWRFLSPDKVVVPISGSPINPILSSIGPTDRSQDVLPNATFPREGDWSYTDEDYIIGPTDIVDISILDLFNEGLETVLRRQVSDSGYIDLPLLSELVKAEGYTKDELKQVIINKYSPNILRDPTISVTIAAQRQNTFSAIGSVARPGTYSILRKDMRLLEAMALVGGVTQVNINYIYVIRPNPAGKISVAPRGLQMGPATPAVLPPEPKEVPGGTAAPATSSAPSTGTAEEAQRALDELQRALQGLVPGTTTKPTGSGTTVPAPSMVAMSETDPAGGSAEPATGSGNTAPPAPAGGPKWIYSGGKWVKAQGEAAVAGESQTKPAQEKEASDPFGWRKVDRSDMARVIAINLNQLRDGDPRMNIVMRNNDIIHVPSLEIGEFYIGGEVSRPGVYSLTGRQITVKMAVVAAGNLNGIAWPENSHLIRRIGGNQEQFIPLNLEAIFRGEDPDLFLKSNDVIEVGTDIRASFFAVIRNAFRMTYGFGFIYDRNFSDPRGPDNTATSTRFTRW